MDKANGRSLPQAMVSAGNVPIATAATKPVGVLLIRERLLFDGRRVPLLVLCMLRYEDERFALHQESCPP